MTTTPSKFPPGTKVANEGPPKTTSGGSPPPPPGPPKTTVLPPPGPVSSDNPLYTGEGHEQAMAQRHLTPVHSNEPSDFTKAEMAAGAATLDAFTERREAEMQAGRDLVAKNQAKHDAAVKRKAEIANEEAALQSSRTPPPNNGKR